MTTLRGLGIQFASDSRITLDEAKQLIAKAQSNGIVSRHEKLALRNIVQQHADKFEPGALELLKPFIGSLPPAPVPTGSVTNLDPSGAHRPVFLSKDGIFTADESGKAPATLAAKGEAIYRAAELVDDASGNVFQDARLPLETREGMLKDLTAFFASVKDGAQPEGVDAKQQLQARASSLTVLLHLMEASSEPSLRQAALELYSNAIAAEPNRFLRENAIFHLSNSAAAQTSPVKEVAAKLMTELAPTTPPYEKWFANGNKTVNLSWTVGEGQFWKGFTNNLEQNGFKPVGAESSYGVTVYEKTVNKPGVGETTFRISVREGGTNILTPMNDPNVQIVGYDGHSDWGRNMTGSVRNGPDGTSGDGKLLFYNLCVGKGVLDQVRAKYPDLQVATTFAASNFYTDSNGQMTRGEGVQALLEMVDGIAGREDWTSLHQRMNRAANIGWGRTWDNYVTPVSTLVREKVLDRDNDGQADYLDKHFNFDTFNVAADTQREFSPVKQPRPSGVLDGTRVVVAANMVNTLSEFSSILDRANRDSKVVPDGYFDPKLGENDLVKFTQAKGADGKTEYRMQVNSRYAHMSEEALRAVTVYEFTRFLGKSNQLGMDAVDTKLAGLVAFTQSMNVDESWRDRELWSTFLTRYNLPNVDAYQIKSLLSAEHHHYAGTPEMVKALRKQLSPELLAELAKPEVGEPTKIIG